MTDVSTNRPNTSLLIRGAIWIAIGALIAAALVCVVWVLIGDQDGLIGRAFLTILLLAGFAGIAIAESSLAPNRPDWLALASMITWIVALLVGAVKIWLPEDDRFGAGAERFFQLLLVVGILQLALLHARIYLKASQRHVTTFTRIIIYATFILMGGLVAMLVFFLTLPDLLTYGELYWRIVVALTILVAVGTTLIPLLNALFAPRKPAAAAPVYQPQPVAPWPTYADARTPLPVLPDGSPDWNAYYTGQPTYPVTQVNAGQSFPSIPAPAAQAPVATQEPTAPALPSAVPPVPQQPAQQQPAQQQQPVAPPAPPVPPAPAPPAAPSATPAPPAAPPAVQAPPAPPATQAPPAAPAPPVAPAPPTTTQND